MHKTKKPRKLALTTTTLATLTSNDLLSAAGGAPANTALCTITKITCL
jgi:hypothetical protein